MASRKFGGTIEAALKDLLNERAVVDDAIQKLQSLLAGSHVAAGEGQKKRGRPVGSTAARKASVVKEAAQGAPQDASKRRSWSPTARRKAAERMRTYWADRRKQKSTGTPKRSRRA